MSAPLPPSSLPERPRRRVVLVDDNPQVLQDLRQLLELTGEMEIVGEAEDGQQAVQLTARLRPEVVVMDLEMPVMNGTAAARVIKSRFPEIRVLILSVHAGPEQQAGARAAGVDGFIIKGANIDVLLDAILAKEDATHLSDPKKGATK